MNDNVITGLSIGTEGTNNILERYQLINNYLKESVNDPTVLLKENIFTNEVDLAFTMQNILLLFGEEGLEEFQSSFSNKVINVIKDKIPYNEVHFNVNIDENGYYYIVLSTVIGERVYPLIYLNHYLKYIYIAENEEVTKILNEIKLIEDEIRNLENYLEQLELSKDNPIHLAGDNSIKMMDMLIRKKKYKEDISQETFKTIDTINQYNNEIAKYKASLSEMDIDITRCSILSDKYIDRLSKYFGYKLIKTDIVEEEINVEYKSYDELDFSQLDFSDNP